MRRPSWKLRRSAEPAKGLRSALLLAALFVVLAFTGRFVCQDSSGTAVFWPANGALVVGMLVLRWRHALLVAALCFGINVTLNTFTGYTTLDNVMYSALNIVSSFTAAILTRRYCGATTDFSRVRRLAAFGWISLLSAGMEAAIGEAIDPYGHVPMDALNDWLQWTICDGLGLVLATPAILLCIRNVESAYPCEASRVERWLLLALTAAVTAVSFLYQRSPAFLLIYPLLVLTAFRAGPPWVLASVLNTAVIASGFSAHGFGPFNLLSSGKMLLGHDIVQFFLITIFMATVPANNALGERSRASRRLKQMQAVVEHAATHDGLTRLVNRNLFRQRLDGAIRQSVRCAVLFIDLDRFKAVNDTLGHAAGDALLRGFSERLQAACGATATVARFGGDEFAVLSAGGDDAAVAQLCRRINETARRAFRLDAGSAHVSASVGVAVSDGGGEDADELMRRADMALYAAKAAGRDGFRTFSADLDRSALERAEIEADLRTALEAGGQLVLYYQSKVGADGTVRGVEALLRWLHPTKGLIAPAQLVPVAEETGLIVPLGDWVIREAVAFAGRWPGLNVAANVSPVQLRHPDFVASTLRAMGGTALQHGRLELEVTETALIDDLAAVSDNLAALRACGIRIALDDFGTGYSSLRHLHRCTVDRVKIDRSFVSGLGGASEASAIVKAVIELGHAMGLQVTAEGVETEAQRRFLVEARVDEMQGYLFARPVSEAEFAAGMRKAAQVGQAGHVAPPRLAVLQGARAG